MKPLISIYEAETFFVGHGERFAATHAPLSKPLGGERIGARVTRVEPGLTAYPFHHHYGTEEHFFIVSGAGTLRCGDETYPVKAGITSFTPRAVRRQRTS